jgi:hypothetical protein
MRKRPAKDLNKTAASQVAKVTKTALPKGEDLLGSEELKRRFVAASSEERAKGRR